MLAVDCVLRCQSVIKTFEPLRFHRVSWRSHRSDRFIPAYILVLIGGTLCSPPIMHYPEHFQHLTFSVVLIPCIICFYMGDIQAPDAITIVIVH